MFKTNEEDRDAVLAILKIGEVTDIDPAKCKIRERLTMRTEKQVTGSRYCRERRCMTKISGSRMSERTFFVCFLMKLKRPDSRSAVFMPEMWMFPTIR